MSSPFLIRPRIQPPLDFDFRPSILARQAFLNAATVPVQIALVQSSGSIFHQSFRVLPHSHSRAAEDNLYFTERWLKSLLWHFGGNYIAWNGPAELAAALQNHYNVNARGRFDAETIANKIYSRPLEIVPTSTLPLPKGSTTPLGRHWEGCRIGFDLGGSDRKVAAVQDGEVVYSDEVVWDPYFQCDPQYHFDGIMDSLHRAARHLPHVHSIGGSAAGVYVDNRVRVASLFRGVPVQLFESRCRELFYEVQRAWNNVPISIVNDGDVTALAGSMALGKNRVYGLAMGTSTAGGYVDEEGNITSRLSEPAFAPVDYQPNAPREEWSGDIGVGAQYFSQQAVGRLAKLAGIELSSDMPLPEKLKRVQALMAQEDERARKIYESIGVYLGYALADYSDLYEIDHVLLLGRVTSGPGGSILMEKAREVLSLEFPDLASRLQLHMPDEKEKRHGQARAAASLPKL